MGQRLNIEIMENERIYANAYYHWGAYTSQGLSYVKEILEGINPILDKEYSDKTVTAIKILELTGAGLTEEELEFANKNFDYKECKGRNSGLIAISEKGMKETQNWEESRITIDITNRIVYFGVYYDYESVESYKEEYGDCRYEQLDIDISTIGFDEFNEVKEKIDNLKLEGFVNSLTGTVYEFIC